MPSFGEKLRKEREQRKITLDDISSTSKISTRMLRALEEEHFDELPGGVFNKGFVRAYARHVGLDEEQTVSDYLEAAGQNPTSVAVDATPDMSVVAAQAAHEERLRSLNSNRGAAPIPWGVLAAILLLVAMALAFWSYRRRAERGKPSVPVSENAPVSSPSAPTEKLKPVANPPTAGTPPVAATGTASSGIGSDRHTSDGISSPASAVEKITGQPTQSPTQTTPSINLPVPSGPLHAFTLVVRATEDSWLSIVTDGKSPAEETLIAGQQQSLPADRQIVIRAGNVGGLVFILNGKQLPSQGDYGEVKTLLFDSNGVRPAIH